MKTEWLSRAKRLIPWTERTESDIRRAVVVAAAVFLVAMTGLSAYFNWSTVEESLFNIAVNEARSSYNKDLVYRRWAAMHGGVYVPPTERTPPNPYLSTHPERDVTTISGKRLTLVNPAYMTRQVHELGNEQYGLQGRITSLIPLRPENAPDEWERAALKEFEEGKSEVFSLETKDHKPFLRFMAPLKTEQICLDCHGAQGYRVGDIRGGISVAVPMESYLTKTASQRRGSLIWHGVICLGGLVALWFGNGALKRSERRILDTKDTLDAIIENLPVPVFFKDRFGNYMGVNKAYEDFMRVNRGDVIGKSLAGVLPPEVANEYTAGDLDVIQSGIATSYEMDVKDRKGDVRHGVFYKAAVKDRLGNVTGLVGAILDVTERRMIEKAIRLSEERLRHIIDFLPDSCFVIDKKGCVVAWNRAMEDLTGIKASEIIGKGDYEYSIPFYGERRPLLADLALRWNDEVEKQYISCIRREDGIIYSESFHPKLKGGVYLSGSARALKDMKGEISFAIETVRDITAQKMLEFHLKAARKASDEASLAKGQFLANVSHEIRTPLNGIMGMTALLLDTELTEEQRRYAEIVKSSGENLLNIINDVLDFSKVEAGKLELEFVDFDLASLLYDLAGQMAVKAHEKGLELVFHVDPAVPALLSGDPGRIRQVLTNLIGNAIKFTESGEVVVKVFPNEAPGMDGLQGDGLADRVSLTFSVRDTGIGIPEDKLSMIFEKFTQVDASPTRRYGGTGLGLAICKELVALMGGELGVKSQEGIGSEFSFTLTLDVRQRKDHPGTAAASKDLEGARILIVDDNLSAREMLVKLLTSWGARAEAARNGQGCLSALHRAADEKDPFKIVIIDMQMPVMDGEELGKRIKSDKEISQVRMVMLTSMGTRGDAGRFRRAGFAAYATKPVHHIELKAMLSLVLSSGDEDIQSRCGITTRYTTKKSWLPRIRVKGRVLVAEDNATNQEVLVGLLRKMGLEADAVADGSEVMSALEGMAYDLVLMDVQMPGMDGIEAARRIREREGAGAFGEKGPGGEYRGSFRAGFRIPIVAMTAHALKGDREMCLSAGMNDYLSKPVSPPALADVVARFLGADVSERGVEVKHEKERTEEGREFPVSHPRREEKPVVFDRLDMMARMMEDRAFAQRVTETFLRDMPARIKGLYKFLEQGLTDELGRQAHTIRGAAANVGGKAMAAAALRLEQCARDGKADELERAIEETERAFSDLKAAILQDFVDLLQRAEE